MATIITTPIGAGEAITTPSSWATNIIPADLVAADEVHVGELADELFLENFVITTKATDATRYVQLKAIAATGFDGTTGSGAIIRGTTSSNVAIINVTATDFFYAQDVELQLGGSPATGKSMFRNSGISTGGIHHLDRVLGIGCNYWWASFASTYPVDTKFTNCIGYDFLDSVFVPGAPETFDFRFCTFVRTETKIDSIDSGIKRGIAHSCYVANFGNKPPGLEVNYSALGAGSETNAASDETVQSAVPITELATTDALVDPTVAGGWNLRPKVGSALLGAGTPIAGVTMDISGNLRDAVNPTIGAFEHTIDPDAGAPPRASLRGELSRKVHRPLARGAI